VSSNIKPGNPLAEIIIVLALPTDFSD